ncbi:hypothetical protein [Tellurirhabdus rosea]|uniref:hypothetical protein n=1 Tax=Tellurirhabdus rosea TaxID=2674997 RepID=UPI0022584FCD|nr:hypothetical protein [Tellurirhabdus rosea]
MNRLLASALLLGAFFFTSCKKETDRMTEPAGAPAFEHGAPTGTATSRTIGPEGGTLTLPDGSVALTVPAGAVTKATAFSIQPVENTLPGARGESFRLLPEDAHFAKPVTLTFSYKNFPQHGTLPEALFLAYQNAEGRYALVDKTQLDKATQTLTVETTHFSDWQICETFRVVADRTTLKRGEKATLKLQEIDLVAPLTGPDKNITPWTDHVTMTSGMKLAWSLVGEGSLVPAQTQCVYTAPGTTPQQNPVLVNLTLSGFTGSPKIRTGASSPQMTIITPIEIAQGDYVKYSFNGETLDINGDCETGCITCEARNGHFSLRTTAPNNRTMSLIIWNFPSKAGNYAFHTDLAGIEVLAGVGSSRYVSSYSSCQSPYNAVFSTGGVTITKWGNVGEYIEGNVTTQLYGGGNCGSDSKPFTLKFRAKRTR